MDNNPDVKKILIIEDEAALLYALQSRLSVEGYQITSISTGEEALKILEKRDFDMIVLDIILPKMDGFEVLKQIQSNPKTKEIPVVIMSNLTQKEKIDKGMELGAKIYLPKTKFDLDSIIAEIKKILF